MIRSRFLHGGFLTACIWLIMTAFSSPSFAGDVGMSKQLDSYARYELSLNVMGLAALPMWDKVPAAEPYADPLDAPASHDAQLKYETTINTAYGAAKLKKLELHDRQRHWRLNRTCSLRSSSSDSDATATFKVGWRA